MSKYKMFGNARKGKHASGAAAGSHRKKKVKKSSGKKNNKGLIFGLLGAAAVILIAIFAVGSVANSRDTAFPNVTFQSIDVGGMNYDEICAALDDAGYSADTSDVTVEITAKDKVVYTAKITAEDANMCLSVDEAATAALEYGHGGAFSSAFKFLGCCLGSKEIGMGETLFDTENVKSIIAQAAEAVDSEFVDTTYVVEDTGIKITKGSAQRLVDQDALYNMVFDAFVQQSYGTVSYDASIQEPTEIDFKAISEQIFVEAENAKYDPETSSVVDGIDGKSLDIPAAIRTFDQAEPGSTFSIPFTITKPEIDAESMSELLFNDVLASKSTSLTSSSNRNNNIKLAAKAINGTVLNPGDVFSFNGTVGQRTTAKGYLEAGAYANGQSVNQVGGGICQVSSTIYYCVLHANLNVVARDNHMFPVSYLPLGMDATVNWGTLDFKFSNNTEYPIKIQCSVDGLTLYVKLLGTKTSDHTFKVTYQTVDTINYNTIEKESTEVKERTVETTGVTGYKVDTYLSEYDGNGNLIKTTYITRSTYRSRDKVILVPALRDEPDDPTPPDTPDTPDDPTPPDTPDDPTPPDDPVTPDDPTPPDTTEAQ